MTASPAGNKSGKTLESAMSKAYVWAADAGHEWLAVKASELVNLNIAHKISSFSYVKGQTVYLEGDCDAAEFFAAYRNQFNREPECRTGKIWDRWPGRSFDRYSVEWMRKLYPGRQILDAAPRDFG